MADQQGRAPEMSRQEMEYLGRLYQNQYAVVTNSLNESFVELQELNAAARSLASLDSIKGKETLHAIGPDTYLTGRFEKSASIIMGVGAGYLVENDQESAKRLLEGRIDKQNRAIERLAKARKELESAMGELAARLG